MKRKVLIFGASLGGKRLLNVLDKGDEVIAFLDNDASKHNTTLKGIPIITPKEGLCHDYDSLIIASQSYSQIAGQLVQMGLDKEKIEVADPAILRGDYELSSNRLGCVGLLVAAIIVATILTFILL